MTAVPRSPSKAAQTRAARAGHERSALRLLTDAGAAGMTADDLAAAVGITAAAAASIWRRLEPTVFRAGSRPGLSRGRVYLAELDVWRFWPTTVALAAQSPQWWAQTRELARVHYATADPGRVPVQRHARRRLYPVSVEALAWLATGVLTPGQRHDHRWTVPGRDTLTNYRITVGEWQALALTQSGRCAVCHAGLNREGIVVDHDHHTGDIRGLLCVACNIEIEKSDPRSGPYDPDLVDPEAHDYLTRQPPTTLRGRRVGSHRALRPPRPGRDGSLAVAAGDHLCRT